MAQRRGCWGGAIGAEKYSWIGREMERFRSNSATRRPMVRDKGARGIAEPWAETIRSGCEREGRAGAGGFCGRREALGTLPSRFCRTPSWNRQTHAYGRDGG